MKKQYSITIILVFLTLALQAQVPGFMGKRAYLQIDANPSPAFFNMNMNHKVITALGDVARAQETNLLAFNIRPQISLEYLVGKSVALGINYQHIITGTVKEVDEYMQVQSFDLLKGDAAGLDIKFYKFRKSGSVAPIGKYSKLGIALSRTNTYNTMQDKQKQFRNDLYYPIISWGFGKQFMPVPNLLIGTGAEFSLPLISTRDNETGVYDTDTSVNHMQNSLIGYYIFNLKFSVGYMLF